MKRLIVITMVVMVVLMGISTSAIASTARARSRERFSDNYYVYYDRRHHGRDGSIIRRRHHGRDGSIIRVGIGYGYGCARARERYGYGYGYGPIYDRFEYTHTAPGYKHHVYDRRSGGVITGIGEFLFGKRELDINIEEGYPLEETNR